MTTATLSDLQEPRESAGARAFKLAAVLGMHIGLLAWLMQLSPAPATVAPPMPMQVRMIEATPPAPQPMRTEPPKTVAAAPKPAVQPKPAAVRPAPAPRQVLAAAPQSAPGPAPFTVAPQYAAPVKQDAPAAQPSPPPAAPAAVATPARFDADYLQNPAPAYPAVSKRLREEGTILLLVRVTAKGEAERVQIQQGSGFTRLDEVAIRTVQQWRFVPARHGAEAIAANVVVPIVFRLDS